MFSSFIRVFAPAFALAAGVLAVYAAALVWGGIDPVSFAFLIGYPFVAGIVILMFRPKGSFKSFGSAIAWMLGVMMLAVLAAVVTEVEGWICIAMAIVPILFGTLLGGILYLVVWRWRINARGAAKVFTLPVAALVLVSAMPSPPQNYEMTHSILIDAPVEVVFSMLKTIPDIHPDEVPTRPSHLLGVPKPTKAVWIESPKGAVRHSYWGENVRFLERITEVDENRLIAWEFEFPEGWIVEGIEDPHVKVGGPYFDVLSGEYRLEPMDRRTRLSLTTRTFDGSGLGAYAKFWHGFFFKDFHETILQVVKARAEA